MTFDDCHLGGWTPVAHYKGVKKFLKRLIYGRRYSKPADRLFQDYYWMAWSRATQVGKNKPVGGLVPSMPPFIQEMGTEVVIPTRDRSTDPYASWDPHQKDCKTCVHNNNVSYCSENCNWDHHEYVEVIETRPQAVLTFDSSVSQEEIARLTKKLQDPETRVKYNNPAGGVWLPAGTSYHVIQELVTNK